MTTWGLCATVKAPLQDTLHFVAYHLEQGAQRVYIYLDDANSDSFAALKPHPKVRVICCDAEYWKGKCPKKHQVRQVKNAAHAYARKPEVEWMIHMDVDEFLVADTNVADMLSTLPETMLVTRIRPMELLAGSQNAFKAFPGFGPDRARMAQDIYPTFGFYLKGGFLSHLAGKLFVRTGLPNVSPRIHKVLQNDEALVGNENQQGIALAHCHAKSWDHWQAAFAYRLEKGSYRAELGPHHAREMGGLSTHDLFTHLHEEEGMSGLRAFFEEVVADSPRLRAKLAEHGLLRYADLGLKDTISAHFPWSTR